MGGAVMWRRFAIWFKSLTDHLSEARKLILTLIELTDKDKVLWQSEPKRSTDLGYSTYMVKNNGILNTDIQFFVEWRLGRKASLLVESDLLFKLRVSGREEVKDLVLAVQRQLGRANPDKELEFLASRYSYLLRA